MCMASCSGVISTVVYLFLIAQCHESNNLQGLLCISPDRVRRHQGRVDNNIHDIICTTSNQMVSDAMQRELVPSLSHEMTCDIMVADLLLLISHYLPSTAPTDQAAVKVVGHRPPITTFATRVASHTKICIRTIFLPRHATTRSVISPSLS